MFFYLQTSPILVILCVILLVVAYLRAVTELELVNRIVPVTSMAIVGTYLLFSQLSVFVINKVKDNKVFYKKNTNMLCIANLHYKIQHKDVFLVTITSAATSTAHEIILEKANGDLEQVSVVIAICGATFGIARKGGVRF